MNAVCNWIYTTCICGNAKTEIVELSTSPSVRHGEWWSYWYKYYMCFMRLSMLTLYSCQRRPPYAMVNGDWSCIYTTCIWCDCQCLRYIAINVTLMSWWMVIEYMRNNENMIFLSGTQWNKYYMHLMEIQIQA